MDEIKIDECELKVNVRDSEFVEFAEYIRAWACGMFGIPESVLDSDGNQSSRCVNQEAIK